MPNQPKTPQRSMRIPEEVWRPALARAAAEGTTVSAAVVAWLRKYGKDYR